MKMDYYYGDEIEELKRRREEAARQTSKEKAAKISGITQATARWYKEVTVDNRTEEGEPGGSEWVVRLDGRALRTPMEHRLAVPSEHMAMVIAAEWEAQKKKILPDTMPVSRLAITTLDRLIHGKAEVRHALVLELLDYLRTDQICYRPSGDRNSALVARQNKILNPYLKWFNSHFHMDVAIHENLLPEELPEITLTGIRLFLHNCTDWELACLDTVASRLRSLILSLALWKGNWSVEEVVRASRVDEDFQMENWGECEGAHDLDLVEIKKMVATRDRKSVV